MKNPRLCRGIIIIFTLSLGLDVAIIRLIGAIMAGVIMGLLIDVISSKSTFIDLSDSSSQDKGIPEENLSKSKLLIRNFLGALKKTGLNLLIGIIISYLLYAVIPQSLWGITFENNNIAVPISAVLSTFLYQCGGGSIPILQGVMREGLPIGASITFMLVGPMTKITNLTALKSIMSIKKLLVYCSVLAIYMLALGWLLG